MTDEEQTKALERLREFLQSIAIMAVRAQENIGNPDFVSDALVDIQSDLETASKSNLSIAADRWIEE